MAEYEREAAREWQQTAEVKATPRRRLLIPTALSFERDSDARSSWRQNEKPTATYQLPADFASEALKPKTSRRDRKHEPAANAPVVIPQIQNIEQETETEITVSVGSPQRHVHRVTVEIWGTPDAARKAVDRLDKWVKSYSSKQTKKAAGHRSFAKVISVTPEERPNFEKKMRMHEEREQFRRAPPEDSVFACVGTFEWDTAYVAPSDILGRNLEACDDIRMDNSCYIVLDPLQNIIKVLGNEADKIKKALKMLRQAFFQAVSRDRANRTESHYLFKALTGVGSHSRVKLVPMADKLADNMAAGAPKVIARFTSDASDKDNAESDKSAFQSSPDASRLKIRQVLDQALSTAKFFKGNLVLRARLGVFALTSYRRASVQSLEDFEAMMEDDQVAGEVLTARDINRSILEGVATILQAPMPKPAFSAAFLLKSAKDPGYFKLDVKFKYTERQDVDAAKWDVDMVARVWSKLMHGPHLQSKLVDVCLIDLQNNSTAWNVEMLACDSISDARLPAMSAFADKVELDLPAALCQDPSKQRFIRFEPKPGVMMQSLVQKETWAFEVGDGGYVCEVERAKEYRLRNPNTSHPDQYDLDTASDPEWRISLVRRSWAIELAQNADLGVGEGVEECPTIETLFPEDEGGLARFLEVLDQIAAVIPRD